MTSRDRFILMVSRDRAKTGPGLLNFNLTESAIIKKEFSNVEERKKFIIALKRHVAT